MGRLFYKPENAWVGDLIPYYENGTYYGFYLHVQEYVIKNMPKILHGIWLRPKILLIWIIKVNQLQEVVFMMPTRTHIQDRLSNVKKMDCIMFFIPLIMRILNFAVKQFNL